MDFTFEKLFIVFTESMLKTNLCCSCNENQQPNDMRPPEIIEKTTTITSIYIFVDTMWPYRYIVNYVNYILQNLNIYPNGSNVTLFAASNGATIVNTTNYMSDLYENWNLTSHLKNYPGFQLPIIYNTLRDYIGDLMDDERNTTSLGGQSLVALLMPSSTAYVSEDDYRYCRQQLDFLKRTLPDLNFLYFAGGAVIRFKDFVVEPQTDLYQLSLEMNVEKAATPVINRIRGIPRRIVNPRCGSLWSDANSGTNTLVQFVPLGDINFYRMSANYFFGTTSMRYLKIEAISGVSFSVCTSRLATLPFRNGSVVPPNVQCAQIMKDPWSFDLTDACDGYSKLQKCPALYFSVQSQDFADPTQVACTQPGCQSPMQAEYLVAVNKLDCFRGSATKVDTKIHQLMLIFVFFSFPYFKF